MAKASDSGTERTVTGKDVPEKKQERKKTIEAPEQGATASLLSPPVTSPEPMLLPALPDTDGSATMTKVETKGASSNLSALDSSQGARADFPLVANEDAGSNVSVTGTPGEPNTPADAKATDDPAEASQKEAVAGVVPEGSGEVPPRNQDLQKEGDAPPTSSVALTDGAALREALAVRKPGNVLTVEGMKAIPEAGPSRQIPQRTSDVNADQDATVAKSDDVAFRMRSRETKNDKNSGDNPSAAGNLGEAQIAAPVQTNGTHANAESPAPVIGTHAAPVAVNAGPTSRADNTVPDKDARAKVMTAVGNNGDVTPTALQSARLMQAVGQSEMRVAFRSPDLGAVSIHTSATNDSIAARIAVDHTELATMLTGQLPEMHARLGMNHTVEVTMTHAGENTAGGDQQQARGDGSTGASSGGHSERHAQPGYGTPMQRAPDALTVAIHGSQRVPAESSGRLDVRI